jgi:hypothetical protein
VREVYRPVERVDDPGGGIGDEVVAGGAGGVGLFADEVVGGVGGGNGRVDVGFDFVVGGGDDVDGGVFFCVRGWGAGAAGLEGAEELGLVKMCSGRVG